MSDEGGVSRRRLLRAGGVACLGVVGAGCSDDESGIDRVTWADVDEIVLEGAADGWIGVTPSVIEDEENPTLGLREGASYDVTWRNVDGDVHNLQFRDDEGTVLAETDDLTDEDSELTTTLEVEAATTEYVCDYHVTRMAGDIVVFDE